MAIQTFIGRPPIFAFGNSDGGLLMREWTTPSTGATFAAPVRHTDAESEWVYDRQSHIGRLDKALDEPISRKWVVVDMKREWRVIYPATPRNDGRRTINGR